MNVPRIISAITVVKLDARSRTFRISVEGVTVDGDLAGGCSIKINRPLDLTHISHGHSAGRIPEFTTVEFTTVVEVDHVTDKHLTVRDPESSDLVTIPLGGTLIVSTPLVRVIPGPSTVYVSPGRPEEAK